MSKHPGTSSSEKKLCPTFCGVISICTNKINQSQHSLTSTVRMSSYTSPSPPKMTTGLSQCGGPEILTMQRQFIIFSCRRCDLSGLVPGTGPLCSSGGSSGRTAGRCGAAGWWHSHSTSWGQGRVDTKHEAPTSASNEGYPKVRNHGEGPY